MLFIRGNSVLGILHADMPKRGGGDKVEWTPEEIRSFKDRHCLTGDSMAATLGVTRSYVFQLMSGYKTPSDTIKLLLSCLDEKTETGKEKARGKAQGHISKR